jgi:hypothetical protein
LFENLRKSAKSVDNNHFFSKQENAVMIKQLSVAYIHSGHGKELAEWYSMKLGIAITAEYPGWTEFEMSQGSRFAVDHTTYPRSVVEKQPVLLSFEVDDIHATVRELAGKGVRFWPSVEETIFDVGPQLVATFIDPDGNFVQLNCPKS